MALFLQRGGINTDISEHTVRDDLYQLRAFTWTTVEPTNQSRNNEISAQLLNTGVLPLEEETTDCASDEHDWPSDPHPYQPSGGS